METAIAAAILQDRKIAYIITDRSLNVTHISGMTEVLTASELAGQGHNLLDIVPELIGCEDVLAEILHGSLPRFELEWINRELASGNTHYFNLVELPYYDTTGHIQGIIHVTQELANAGEIEQQLAQQRNELRLLKHQFTRQNLELKAMNAELERLDELKSQFVAVAAHELRSPLTTIKVYVSLMLASPHYTLTQEQRERLSLVLASVDRLVAIIEDLLDVTRIEIGRIELELQPTDFGTLVENVIDELQPRFEAKEQNLILQIAPNLPDVLCDRKRAMQIMVNLLSNANKYTGAGGAVVLSITPSTETGFIQVSIADTGVGIAAEDQRQLFRRFFRAKSAVLTQATGVGLGLHITRGLVELHGGRIWFESELGDGSTFFITLPVAETAETATDMTDAPASPQEAKPF
jgi:signal transduction histidine kinase